MKPLRVLSLLTLLLILAGCAAPVRVEVARQANFTDLRRFAWLPPPGKHLLKNPIVNSGIITQRVKHAVVAVLRNRGFSYRKKPSQAQFLVTDHILSHRQFVCNPPFYPGFGFGFPYYDDYFYPGTAVMVGGWGWGYGCGYSSYTYRQADLIIDIIDAKTRHLIWRGWESQVVSRSNFSMRAIYRMVNHILHRFPPR